MFFTSIYSFTPSCTSLFREYLLGHGNDFDHSILSKSTDCQSVSPFAKSLSRYFGREDGGCKTDVNAPLQEVQNSTINDFSELSAQCGDPTNNPLKILNK